MGPFNAIGKHSVHLGLNKRLELDLLAEAEHSEDPDLAVEVKDWSRPVGAAEVREMIERKEHMEPHLKRPALFMLYSERGFAAEVAQQLAEHQILTCHGDLLPEY